MFVTANPSCGGPILATPDGVFEIVVFSLLLDFLNDPAAVSVVRHTDKDGTRVIRETNPDAVQQALKASGFGLGEFYETKGFGG